MDYSLNWKEKMILNVLKKYLAAILFFSVLLAVLGVLGYAKVEHSTYSASGQLVQNDNNYGLVSSYSQFVNSSKFKRELEKKINNSSKWKSYENRNKYTLSFSADNDSPFFTIEIMSGNPNYSRFLLDSSVQVFTNNIGKYLSGTNISVISRSSKATVTDQKKSLVKIGILVWLVTFVLLSVITIVNKLLIGKMKDEEFVAEYLQIKHLGTFNSDVL